MLAVAIALIGAAGVVLAAVMAYLGVRTTSRAAARSEERRHLAEREARQQAADAVALARVAENKAAELAEMRERADFLAAEAERVASYHERLHAAHRAELDRAYARIAHLEGRQ